ALAMRHTRRVFFFSSRRRHTRSKRDWSSDVCSSDLGLFAAFIEYLVAEQHEHTAYDKHDGHYRDTLQHGVDEIAAQQSQHGSRNEGHKQLPVKIILMKKTCQRRSSHRSRCMVQPEETLPIKHHHRQDGTKLYDECKRLDKFCPFHTQTVLRDNQV